MNESTLIPCGDLLIYLTTSDLILGFLIFLISFYSLAKKISSLPNALRINIRWEKKKGKSFY